MFQNLRQDPTNTRLPFLKYEIREIVDFVHKVKDLEPDLHIEYENIGDPIAKGWPVPAFLKELIIEETKRKGDKVFAYSHSRGNPQTREWIANYSRRFCPESQLDYEDVLISSGLGAGISAVYHMLPEKLRIIQPSPSYPTHASMESFAANKAPISYRLDPENNWQPDLEDLEAKLKEHDDIVGILLINPNNPTGAVYSKETVEAVVQLAEKYGCMIISDEIYFRMIYNGHTFAHITSIAHNRVPLIVMRGLSKDVPWPGARCGWLEFHNQHLDKNFKNYCDAVKKRILMEVCSVTLPQVLLPKIYDHPEFDAWIKNYTGAIEHSSNQVAEILSKSPMLNVNRTNGAFYMMPIFKKEMFEGKPGRLHIANPQLRAFVESKVSDPSMTPDKRFCYYLLATTGICTVPASSFFSPHYGFRITTLDRDEKNRVNTYEKLVAAIEKYNS